MGSLRVTSLNVNGCYGTKLASGPVDAMVQAVAVGTYDIALFQEFPAELLAGLSQRLEPLCSITELMLSTTAECDGQRMGLVTVTRLPVCSVQHVLFPNPRRPVKTPLGPRPSHEKGALVVAVEHPSTDGVLHVVNLHAFPFHRCGLSPRAEPVDRIWRTFAQRLGGIVPPGRSRVLVGGDFNLSDRTVVDRWLEPWGVEASFAKTETRPDGRCTDDIYLDAPVVEPVGDPRPVGSDHYQISVELDLSGERAKHLLSPAEALA